MRVSARSLVIAAVFILSVVNSFFGSANAQLNNPKPSFNFILPNLTLHYGDVGFLRTPLINDFCAPVPNVPAMILVQPKDFVLVNNATCSQGKFAGAVILSALGSIIPLLGVLSCICICPCVGFFRYKLGFFGGHHPTPVQGLHGLVLPGDVTAGIKQGYHLKDINAVKASYLVIFGLIMVGSLFVIASTQMISTFIYDTNQIFVDYTDFNVDTVEYVHSSIYSLSTSPSDRAIADQALSIADDLQDSRKKEISSGLGSLAYFVEVIMYLTVILVFFVLTLGILAGWLHIPKLALFLAFALVFLLALVWIDFTVAYAASNILNKMCDTINGCHFCIEGQLPGCPKDNGDPLACQESWFQSMRNCDTSDANRYLNLTNLIQSKGLAQAVQTCADLNQLCSTAGYTCIYEGTTGCDATTLLKSGLNVWVTLGNGTTFSIDYLAANNVTVLAKNVLQQYSGVQMYASMWQQLDTLNCDSGNAFIESTPGPGGIGYHGTYDRLQEQLCPMMSQPQWSIFQMIQFLAVGLIIMGLFIPCAQVLLCLGDKRWRRNATVAPMLTGDYETREINSIEVTPIRTGTTSIFDRN